MTKALPGASVWVCSFFLFFLKVSVVYMFFCLFVDGVWLSSGVTAFSSFLSTAFGYSFFFLFSQGSFPGCWRVLCSPTGFCRGSCRVEGSLRLRGPTPVGF